MINAGETSTHTQERFSATAGHRWLLVFFRLNLPAVDQTIHVVDFFIRPVSPVVLP